MPSRVVAPTTVNLGSVNGMDEAPGPLAHHDVDAEILHGDVQQFLRGARKTVDLVDEQHFPCVQRAEYRSQVARVLDCRTGRDANRHLQLVGYDHRQRGLAQSGRAGEQDVVGGGVTFAGGVQEQLRWALSRGCPMNPSRA